MASRPAFARFLNLDYGAPVMRQPIRFSSDTETQIPQLSDTEPEFATRPTAASPLAAVHRTVRRNNSAALRAILVIVLVALLAMLAYLISLSSRPSVTSLLPEPGTVSEPGLVTVEARVTAAKPIEQVTLSIDGVTITPAVTTIGDRSWIVRFQSVFPRGTHTAIVKVRDSKGGQQTQTWSFEASGPRISPSIAFTDPPSNATLPEGIIWIHAAVESDANISSATLSINGLSVPVQLTPDRNTVAMTTSTSDSQTRAWNIESEHSFSAGSYTAHIVATDAQGDTSEADWHFVVTADPVKASTRFFASSKLYVSGKFLTFWESNHGSALFGDPVTAEFTNSQGTDVQYFENARFEMSSGGEVALGLLGDEALKSTQQPVKKPTGFSGLYFDATGHTLAGRFQEFWQANGGLQIFGYPISEVLDQNGTKVQYFERSRFELAKDGTGSTVVKLTPLGSQIWASKQSTTTP